MNRRSFLRMAAAAPVALIAVGAGMRPFQDGGTFGVSPELMQNLHSVKYTEVQLPPGYRTAKPYGVGTTRIVTWLRIDPTRK